MCMCDLNSSLAHVQNLACHGRIYKVSEVRPVATPVVLVCLRAILLATVDMFGEQVSAVTCGALAAHC